MREPGTVYAVVGASGTIGSRVAAALLRRGARVRGIGRSAERLRPLAAQGVEPRVAAMEDEAALAEALRDAEAAFLMTPQLRLVAGGLSLAGLRALGRQLAAAFARSGVRRAVHLSGLGVHHPGPPEQLALLRDQERELERRAGGAELVHLRPGFFLENLLELAAPVRALGALPYTLDADLPVPMVAVRDIADVAADLLVAPLTPLPPSLDLVGPRDRTMAEVARLFASVLGRPSLPYLRLSDVQVERSLRQAGVPADLVRSAVELNRFMNDGQFRAATDDPPRHLTPTPLEDLAPALADAFRALQ